MTKDQVIKGAVALIQHFTELKGLDVWNKGTGHAFDNTVWKGIAEDNSNIPNVSAKGADFEIELRSFWGSPEIDVHRATPFGEQLLIFRLGDGVKTAADEKYRHTGNYFVSEVRVDTPCFGDYRRCIEEVYSMINFVELHGAAPLDKIPEPHCES